MSKHFISPRRLNAPEKERSSPSQASTLNPQCFSQPSRRSSSPHHLCFLPLSTHDPKRPRLSTMLSLEVRGFQSGSFGRFTNEPYFFPCRIGGAAGSIVASRLSENPSTTVLLLEAGPEYVFLSPHIPIPICPRHPQAQEDLKLTLYRPLQRHVPREGRDSLHLRESLPQPVRLQLHAHRAAEPQQPCLTVLPREDPRWEHFYQYVLPLYLLNFAPPLRSWLYRTSF